MIFFYDIYKVILITYNDKMSMPPTNVMQLGLKE